MSIFLVRGGIVVSDQLLVVDDQFECQSQLFSGFPAENHALEKDLEIIHDRTEMCVDGKPERDDRMCIIDFQFGTGERIIDAVMDIERGNTILSPKMQWMNQKSISIAIIIYRIMYAVRS